MKAAAYKENLPTLSLFITFCNCNGFLPDPNVVLAVIDICRHYQNVTDLNLHGVINAEILVLEAIMFLRSFLFSLNLFLYRWLILLPVYCIYLLDEVSCRHLKTLTMGKGQLGEAFFQALAECPLLTTLTVTDASLGSGIQEVTVNHDGLRELQILKCRALRISVRCLTIFFCFQVVYACSYKCLAI